MDHYANTALPLLLPAVEEGVLADNWRIRQVRCSRAFVVGPRGLDFIRNFHSCGSHCRAAGNTSLPSIDM